MRKQLEVTDINITGGLSLGDEPDGSGRFISTAMEKELDAVMELLEKRWIDTRD